MKVYILLREHSQETEILGVYSSLEKAQHILDNEISAAWKAAVRHFIQEEEVV